MKAKRFLSWKHDLIHFCVGILIHFCVVLQSGTAHFTSAYAHLHPSLKVGKNSMMPCKLHESATPDNAEFPLRSTINLGEESYSGAGEVSSLGGQV